MFRENIDMIPRTYSIRSYRKRESSVLKKALKSIIYMAGVVIISGMVLLYYI